MLNLLGAGVLSISSSLLFPFFAHATVIYQNDFSTDPHWMTDDPISNHWEQATSALAFRTINGPQTGGPDRYFAIPTLLNSLHSFTLTWRQMMTSSTPSAVVPFGILNAALVRESSSPPNVDGFVSVFSGNFQGNNAYLGYRITPKNGSLPESGNSLTSAFLIEQGKWYQGNIVYDADAQSISYSYAKEGEINTSIWQAGPYTGTYQPFTFGISTLYIGMSMYAVSETNSVSESYPGSAEGFIDDVKLEDDTVIVPSSTRPILSFSSSTPYNGVRGVSPEKGVPNDTVFTFKTVFTDSANHAPSSVVAILGSTTLAMTLDTNASSSLHDGDYRNGEAYTATTTIGTLGTTTYSFTASNSSGTTTLAGATPIVTKIAKPSVLFLPGIEASRLYTKRSGTNFKLWEPIDNSDIRNLAMNFNGSSINQVYTKDVVDKYPTGIFSRQDVYGSFLASLDALQASGTINAWSAFPYDWRQSVDDIVEHGTPYEDGLHFPVAEIERLAASGGKVTIVAHSNGGLLAKALMLKLASVGKANLVDKIIFVATPELGTPKAIGVLLHGYDQELGYGYIVDDVVARDATKNMPGAYGLLPSDAYFAQSSAPIITFDSSSSTQAFRNAYGSSVSGGTALANFMQGTLDNRPDPITEYAASKANQNMLYSARALHTALDAWRAPTSTTVYEIVGTGLDTLSGIYYREFEERTCFLCAKQRFYKPMLRMTENGDGTVVATSASAYGGQKNIYYMNIQSVRQNTILKKLEHSSILSLRELQQFILSAIGDSSVSLNAYISTTTIPFDGMRDMVSLHSPASITAVDSLGNITGTQGVGSSTTVVEGIPGSSYTEFGGSKYLIIPSGTTYTIQIHGTGEGSYSLVIDSLAGDKPAITIASISDATVTPALIASFSKTNGIYSPLKSDINGDGIIDTVIPLQKESMQSLFFSLEKAVQQLPGLKKHDREELFESVLELEKAGNRWGYTSKKFTGEAKDFVEDLQKLKKKKLLTETQYLNIVSIINRILIN